MDDDYISELVESIRHEGLRNPPIGDEGNHRILAFAKMDVPMPYFQPILAEDVEDDEGAVESAHSTEAQRDGEHIMVFDVVLNKQPHKVGVVVERSGMQMSETTMLALARQVFVDLNASQDESVRQANGVLFDGYVEQLKQATRTFTPAAFKSLLQKLIRYAPDFIVCDNADKQEIDEQQ